MKYNVLQNLIEFYFQITKRSCTFRTEAVDFVIGRVYHDALFLLQQKRRSIVNLLYLRRPLVSVGAWAPSVEMF